MGRIGDCYDISMIESFWSRMQVELLDGKDWNTQDPTVLEVGLPRHRDRRG